VRRFLLAAMVGAAVIVAPGGPSPGRGPGWRPPAYERALRWRDIIRLRLSPWLLGASQQIPADAPDRTRTTGDRPADSRWPWA
jgi:hypothetical protein